MLRRFINRLRLRPVIYDNHFFQQAWFKEWETLKTVLAAMIESDLKWQSILDFGCGPGIMIDFMRDRQIDYVGCDYSREAHQLYLANFGKYPEFYFSDLDIALEKNKDLLIAFDVLEHMSDQEIVKLVESTRSVPEYLFNISRTRGIPGHINIKSDASWIKFLHAQGLIFDELRTNVLRKIYLHMRPGSPDYWHQNLFLFRQIHD